MKQILLTIALMIVSPLAWSLTYTVEIPEKELQGKISAMMPLEKKTLFMTIILSNPIIELLETDNKIGITSNIKVLVPGGMKGTGKAKIVGALSYDQKRGEFYFKNPKLVKLEIDGVPKSVIPKVKNIAETAAKKMLSKRPIYKLKDDDFKQSIAKSVLQSITVKKSLLLVELSVF